MARYYKGKRIGADVYTQGKFGKGLREIVDTDNPLLYSIFELTDGKPIRPCQKQRSARKKSSIVRISDK